MVELAIAVAVLVWTVSRVVDLVAHVARYRRHRRHYPSADAGSTWDHTRPGRTLPALVDRRKLSLRQATHNGLTDTQTAHTFATTSIHKGTDTRWPRPNRRS